MIWGAQFSLLYVAVRTLLVPVRLRYLLCLSFLVSEWFTGLQGEGDALLGFAFSAEGQKGLALEIEEILFANHGAGGNGSSTQDVRDVVGDLLVVVADVVGLAHEVNAEFERRQGAFTGGRDFAGDGRRIACAGQRDGSLLARHERRDRDGR